MRERKKQSQGSGKLHFNCMNVCVGEWSLFKGQCEPGPEHPHVGGISSLLAIAAR